MEYLELLLLISFVLACIHLLFSNLAMKTPKNKLPPGPKPFPIIGNILELGTHPHLSLSRLSQIYGPIITLKLGNITTIVISSPQLAKEVLHKHDKTFCDRQTPDTLTALDHHKVSVIWLPLRKKWRNLRRICADNLFSIQKLDSTQVLRQKKVQELLDFVKEKSEKGESLDMSNAAFITVLNFISNTFFSIDLAHYDSFKSQEFKDIVWGIMEEIGRPNVVDFFPMLRMLDPQGTRGRMKRYFKKLINFFDGLVEERVQRRGLEGESNGRKDLLDSMVDLMLEDNSELSQSQVLHLLMDLFNAGIDTTSSMIEWAMAELVRNPKELKKVREELHQVLGKEQQIEESHISKLPFLRAVVKETFRLHPPAPLLLPHKSPQEDIELCGFMVPKNAQVWVNVWGMGRDSSIWTNPNEFMPQRFLESNIDFRGNDFELIPFGAGRRICPGLPLAFRSVHIVLASLLYGYDWKLPNELEAKDIDMSENFGITLHKAQPLQIIPIKS
ncbi:cytochrome P450 76T24-like [Arachis stenosperma]|uniref:cytochrome P450 76T24-like n=1 Tax=Arachis stenosperma TaxID=217475 RepID=UPI0025AD4B09|nr:cytochrome P450 76T24-like [Arachis stenosperma]